MTSEKTNANSLQNEFEKLTGINLQLDKEYKKSYEKLCDYIGEHTIRPYSERKKEFITLVNKKFDLNSASIAQFYAAAASLGFTFNFHIKKSIEKAFNQSDERYFRKVLNESGIFKKDIDGLVSTFRPVSEKATISFIRSEINAPTKLRVEKGERDIGNEIAKSMFSAFLWVSMPEELMHSHFDPTYEKDSYQESFWKQLQLNNPELFNRREALHVIRINENVSKHLISLEKRHAIFTELISKLFHKINNHGHLAVVIEPITINGRFAEWEIAADLILIGEKFKETKLDKQYFQWQKVEQETLKHISTLDAEDARFDLVNEGFTYKDTFVLSDKDNHVEKLILILQKNDRDETIIPCPACRSTDVRGNSYSSFGVKSWECQNPLCPDRSKYNRGKRYSFKGLLMQEAIQDESNLIPKDTVRRWQKDVVREVEDKEILDMLIRHYSMASDTVNIHNWNTLNNGKYLGRTVVNHPLILKDKNVSSFFDGHFIKRYIAPPKKVPLRAKNLGDDTFQVFCGDSAQLLKGFEENVFDGAVTSPPYFNAREYSQWSNMYCYLHDMLEVNQEVFRTLKPGSLYLYNIFDYFDNENIVTSSAMGQKRMILSAYTVDLFRRIGFELIGNIPWDKGDIEGKRGFNAGNFSPFYQSPFNCWEHILIFRKPGVSDPSIPFQISNTILECKPVFKMIKGENTYGHTAPYPEEIPELLASLLPPQSLILDPFSGSLTTGRVAEQMGHRSVNLEMSEEYCNLGLKMRNGRPPFIS